MITFVVPVRNEEKILGVMLQSLRKLTLCPMEIIVSDGGSADSTVRIARAFADIVIEHTAPERQNIAMGRNAGAAAAHGEFLVFMDADVFIPDMNAYFARALKRFEDPKLVGLIARLQVLPESRTFADWFFSSAFNLLLYVTNNVLRRGHAQGEFQMMRTAAFCQVGGFDEHIVSSEDMELFMRLTRIGKTRMDPELIVFHTGRRAHTIGWIPMLALWTVNGISVRLGRRSVSKEWREVR